MTYSILDIFAPETMASDSFQADVRSRGALRVVCEGLSELAGAVGRNAYVEPTAEEERILAEELDQLCA